MVCWLLQTAPVTRATSSGRKLLLNYHSLDKVKATHLAAETGDGGKSGKAIDKKEYNLEWFSEVARKGCCSELSRANPKQKDWDLGLKEAAT